MILDRRHRITHAFSAAREYDRNAHVQRVVAHELAERIAALDLPANPQILEIGCGTGFLTEALAEKGIGGEWLITDLSESMLERCRRRIGEGQGRHFALLDGEYGTPEGDTKFDLICSNLALQWFDDIEPAVARLLDWLAPGGALIFTTLSAGTFTEWRAAHTVEGLTPGTPPFPTVAHLAAMQPQGIAGQHWVDRHIEEHHSAHAFLLALKAIGAATASQRHRPLHPAALRHVMRNFEEAGSRVSYEVVTCLYRRDKTN
jgi:malonyl-CoA O-methyltransferase